MKGVQMDNNDITSQTVASMVIVRTRPNPASEK
jgi:hypothetical protein